MITRRDDQLAPSRMRSADTVRLALSGFATRPLRAFLSALGIAIGIAAMIAVVGISASSRAEVNAQLRALGTNLLRVTPGQDLFTGDTVDLAQGSADMVARIAGVTTVSPVGVMSDLSAYRSDRIDPVETGGITVTAVRPGLLTTLGGSVRSGRWFDGAFDRYPTVVLGSKAAERLGVTRADGSVAIMVGDRLFTVVGILEPLALAPEADSAVFVGWDAATAYLGFDGHPSTLFVRTAEDAVGSVRSLLAATASPEHPEEVEVSRPSDALAAQAATDATLTTLLLALGGIALFVGAIGVANTMIIAVLERQSEIGLRRALGATRAHVRQQFLGEAVLLSGLGGAGGAVLGGLVTATFAELRGWSFALPPWVLAGAAIACIVVGALAGIYPAARAARMAPTAALAGP